MKATFVVLFLLLHCNEFSSANYPESLQPEANIPSDILIPSRIIVNYLSKYFGKSDKFVKIRISSRNVDRHRFHLELIDTIIKDEALSSFTFEVKSVNTANKEKSDFHNWKHIRRSPFYLFIIDSIEAFP